MDFSSLNCTWLRNGLEIASRQIISESSAQCDLALSLICNTPSINSTTPVPINKKEGPTELEVWGYGFLFVILISLSSVVGVLFLPLMKHDSYEKVLMGMVGLAVGCLCGSAIFTLIPEAYGFTPEDDYERYLYKSCVIVAAIYAFFLAERLLKIFVEHRKRVKEGRKPASLTEKQLESSPQVTYHQNGENGHANGEAKVAEDSFDGPDNVHCGSVHLHAKVPPADVKTHAHEHAIDSKELLSHPIKTVAFMIVTGDGIHNFVDGLSIGAAFREGVWEGISISIAVLCEELPHELGDLAILLNSGMSLKRALLYNFLSACTCFAGLICGIMLGGLPEASTWIFAIAGGMFLYISLVDMLPEMTHSAEEASRVSGRRGLTMLLVQNIGMLLGFVLMYLLARYKKNFEF